MLGRATYLSTTIAAIMVTSAAAGRLLPTRPAPTGIAMYEFTLNPQARHEIVRIGREQQPVVVIDGALHEPRSVVNYAARRVRFRAVAPGANFYPGVRAPVPQQYMASLFAVVRPFLQDVFELSPAMPLRADCSFSLVTLEPEQLNVLQRLPHFDTVDPHQVAVLHYLCDATNGGTAFYRHRGTDFERIDAERQARYLAALEHDTERYGSPPAAYFSGSDQRFEQIARFDVRFDRILMYRSQLLHAGEIGACTLSADPRVGRLTANAFFAPKAAAAAVS